MITKEEFLSLLQKNISCIDSKLCSNNYEDILEIPLRDCLMPCDWSIEAGISKAVFLIKGADYVIKLPFLSRFDEDGYQDAVYDWEHQDEDAEDRLPEPQEDDDYWYYEFTGASSQAFDDDAFYDYVDWDYCNLETRLYQEAVTRGLGAYFAEESLLGYIDDHPVYCQTRCTPLCALEIDYCSEDYEKKTKASRATCKELNIECFNSYWISDFISAYGTDELKRLYEFLREFNIDDLRDCNIGYLDGAPILFDYSGYREWD